MKTVKTKSDDDVTSISTKEDPEQEPKEEENAPIDKSEWEAFCEEMRWTECALQYNMLEEIIDGIRRGKACMEKQLHEPLELLAAIFNNVVTTRLDVATAFKKFHEEANSLFIFLNVS